MSEDHCKEVLEKLDILIRIVALSVVAERPRQEQCELLGDSGLTPRQIAEILGTTPNTVSVALSKMRKERTKGRKR